MKNTVLSFALMLLAFVFVPQLALAQANEVFTVLACKGKITHLRTGKPIVVGLGLFSNDVIRMEGSVYLGLLHKSGITVEVRNAGIVSMADQFANLAIYRPTPQWMEKLVAFVIQLVKAEAGKNITFSTEEFPR